MQMQSEINQYRERMGENSQEFEEFKNRIQRLISENQSLGEELRTAQDSIRLSANTNQKLMGEIASYRDEISNNNN